MSSFWRTPTVLVAVALVVAGVTGCPPGPTFVVQQYAGPQRPRESIAVLRLVGAQPVRLVLLDGEDVAAPIVPDGRLHIELLPRRHTLVVANAEEPGERYAPIVFEPQAGQVYRVAFVGGDKGARVFEVDRESDKVLRDVTIEPSSSPAATPPAPAPAPRSPVPADDGGS